MLDALLGQQLLELALAPPGKILATLVREQLLGLAEALHPFEQCLLHEGPGLLHAELPADHVAAVVVHEGHQVQPLVVPWQHEAGDVGLPELTRRCPFEAPGHGRVAPAPGLGLVLRQLGLLDGLVDELGASFDGLEALQEGRHLAHAEVRELLFDLRDGFDEGHAQGLAPRLDPPVLFQGLRAVLLVCRNPAHEGPWVHAPDRAEALEAHAGPKEGLHGVPPLLGRVLLAPHQGRRDACRGLLPGDQCAQIEPMLPTKGQAPAFPVFQGLQDIVLVLG